MTTTSKIKNRKIILPASVGARWHNTKIEIHPYGLDRIMLERTSPDKRQHALEALKATAGILKGKIRNPVTWQRTIRKEWDRKLPTLHVRH